MASFTNFLPTTVFDLEVYEIGGDNNPLFTITSLKVANFTQEGPEKTARGGKHNEIIARYGKTTRLEMEDAILSKNSLKYLFGADTETSGTIKILDTFPSSVKLVGKTFFIDPDSGNKIEATFTVPIFSPDGLLNLTMEAEGEFGIIELNGEVIADNCGNFYVITTEGAYSCS